MERPPLLRRATPADVPRLVAVVTGATPERRRTRSDGSIAYDLEQRVLPTAEVWVAERDGDVVGAVGVRNGEVVLLHVVASAQGRGVGRALVGRALELAGPGLRVIVPSTDHRALAFLGARGFVWDGEREIDGESCTELRGPGPEPAWW